MKKKSKKKRDYIKWKKYVPIIIQYRDQSITWSVIAKKFTTRFKQPISEEDVKKAYYRHKNSFKKTRGGKITKESKYDKDLATRVLDLLGGEKHRTIPIAEMSDEEIKYYSTHHVEFIEKYMYWNGNHIKLDDYQKRLIRDTSRMRIVSKSRRVGITWCICLDAFVTALFVPYSTHIFLSIKDDRARDMLKYVKIFYESNPLLFEGIIEKDNSEIIELRNHSTIISLPNSPSGIRGTLVKNDKLVWVYIDEFAHFKESSTMWDAAAPMIALGGKIIVISTHLGRQSKFYELWESKIEYFDEKEQMLKEVPKFSRHEIMWYDCPRLKDREDELRRACPDEATFRQEHCCEPMDETTATFPYELIDSCIDPELSYTQQPKPDKTYFIGLDIAFKTDFTAIVVSEYDEKYGFVLVDVSLFKNTMPDEIVNEVLWRIKTYNPKKIFVDESGLGIPIYRLLCKSLNVDIEDESYVVPIYFTVQTRDKLIMNLHALARNGRLKFPHDRDVINHLHSIQKSHTTTGMARYTNRRGKHDDIAWAIAMSCSEDVVEPEYILVMGSDTGDIFEEEEEVI